MNIYAYMGGSVAKLVIRAAGNQAKMANEILQLCAGIVIGIKGETHAVAQMRQERTMSAPLERAGKHSVEGSTEDDSNKGRGRIAEVVGDVGEVPVASGGEGYEGQGQGQGDR